MKKIVFFNNNLSGMISFRKEVMEYFVSEGNVVYIVAPPEDNRQLIGTIPQGVLFCPIKMDRTSINPLGDMILFLKLLRVFRKIKPDYVFNYTIKPNIYGALACRFLGIKNTDMIAGLGYTFTNNHFSSLVARLLYRIGLKATNHLLVLNKSNYDTIMSLHLCPKEKVFLLYGGEGVSLERYPVYDNESSEKTVFLFIGRLIEEKGYNEFVGAAKQIKSLFSETVEFQIAGDFDLSYPKHITKSCLENDVKEGYITYLGNVKDINQVFSQKGIVVTIPSYYSEGLNRSLMEGCATGKPIITTDWPGCKETVIDGYNGYLVKPRDISSLVDAILKYLHLNNIDKAILAHNSRLHAEKKFDVSNVIRIYQEIVGCDLEQI